uniref:Serine/arginine repetitive matrix protein 1-like n=1 Tax=Davidia involucrata TaxID=16924 RepID=A0A5B6ZT44_DAVIN
MGCCASTTNKAPSAPHKPRPSSAALIKPSRAPPPPSFEEETVKEVLSETPTLKPTVPKIEEEEKKNIVKLALQKIQEEDDEDNVDKKSPMVATEEISEVSEICSLSERVTTTTVTEKSDDDDGEVRQRVDRPPVRIRNRSFSGDFSVKRDRMVGKSPVGRSEPSPGRVRSVPGRERRGLLTEGKMRGSGDSSGRRSRSPATRTDGGAERPGLGRSLSARRTGKSPGRVGSELPERVRRVGETNREVKWPPTTNESLENPLVSLECFIFL